MNKYLALAKIRLIDIFNHRAELILWQIIDFVPMITMLIIWTNVSNNQVGSFTIPQLVTYYFLSLFISRLTSYYFSEYEARNIRTGEFSKYLLKPFPLEITFFIDSLLRTTFRFIIISIPLMIIVWSAFRPYINVNYGPNLLYFSAMIILANIMNFLIQMIILSAAFYLKTVEGIRQAQWMFTSIIGGSIIPITFLPHWLQTISRYLPFRLLYFYPISIYMGRFTQDEIISGIFQAIIWVVVLWLVFNHLWKQGLKKYSAVGG